KHPLLDDRGPSGREQVLRITSSPPSLWMSVARLNPYRRKAHPDAGLSSGNNVWQFESYGDSTVFPGNLTRPGVPDQLVEVVAERRRRSPDAVRFCLESIRKYISRSATAYRPAVQVVPKRLPGR